MDDDNPSISVHSYKLKEMNEYKNSQGEHDFIAV